MLSRIEIVRSVEEAAAPWRRLEAHALASPFQSYRWLEAWSRLVAPHRDETPLLVLGFDARDEPVLLLPFATSSTQGATVLSWLGQEHQTYAMGLYAPEVVGSLSADVLRDILDRVVAVAPGISSLNLTNQPAVWLGQPNPFLALGGQENANRSHQLQLTGDFEGQVLRALKKHTRGKLRRSLAALQALPGYALDLGDGPSQRAALLESFLDQKARQLADKGIPNPFGAPELQRFYRDLAEASGERESLLECQGIRIAGEAIATSMSVTCHGQRHLLTLSLGTGDPALLKLSPGLSLIHLSIAQATADAIALYDFGAGEGQHKAMWQPAAVPLFDTYLPLSLRGYAVSLAAASGSLAKRIIKNNRPLWQAAQSMRRILNAKRR
ncbi:MAG: GNAT family N-acetyltransferase [Hyphomicrobiaceae bacterium]